MMEDLDHMKQNDFDFADSCVMGAQLIARIRSDVDLKAPKDLDTALRLNCNEIYYDHSRAVYGEAVEDSYKFLGILDTFQSQTGSVVYKPADASDDVDPDVVPQVPVAREQVFYYIDWPWLWNFVGQYRIIEDRTCLFRLIDYSYARETLHCLFGKGQPVLADMTDEKSVWEVYGSFFIWQTDLDKRMMLMGASLKMPKLPLRHPEWQLLMYAANQTQVRQDCCVQCNAVLESNSTFSFATFREEYGMFFQDVDYVWLPTNRSKQQSFCNMYLINQSLRGFDKYSASYIIAQVQMVLAGDRPALEVLKHLSYDFEKLRKQGLMAENWLVELSRVGPTWWKSYLQYGKDGWFDYHSAWLFLVSESFDVVPIEWTCISSTHWNNLLRVQELSAICYKLEDSMPHDGLVSSGFVCSGTGSLALHLKLQELKKACQLYGTMDVYHKTQSELQVRAMSRS